MEEYSKAEGLVEDNEFPPRGTVIPLFSVLVRPVKSFSGALTVSHY